MHFVTCEQCEGVALLVTMGPCCSGEDITVYPNSCDANPDNHIPNYEVNGDRLYVKVDHLSEKKNRIDWIYLETEDGGMIKKIPRGEKPEVFFNIKDETPVALYAYCLKHGVWKCEIKEKAVED